MNNNNMDVNERELSTAEERQWLIKVINAWDLDYNRAKAQLLQMSSNDNGFTTHLNAMLRAKSNVDDFTVMLNRLDDPG